MKVEDVPAEWVDLAADAFTEPFRAALDAFSANDTTASMEAALRAALAAVAPLMRRAALEEAAGVVDCGCAHKADVLAVRDENSGDRWRACGSSPCGALEARAIRALDA